MAKRALITWGGWPGHEPDKVAALFAGLLRAEGFAVEVTDTLACFDDPAALTGLDLIVPIWTMSTVEKERTQNVADAVASGVGLAGCHGGMCDAFRNDVVWQFMTGAQWVAHPGNDGVEYRVRMVSDDPLVAGDRRFRRQDRAILPACRSGGKGPCGLRLSAGGRAACGERAGGNAGRVHQDVGQGPGLLQRLGSPCRCD